MESIKVLSTSGYEIFLKEMCVLILKYYLERLKNNSTIKRFIKYPRKFKVKRGGGNRKHKSFTRRFRNNFC